MSFKSKLSTALAAAWRCGVNRKAFAIIAASMIIAACMVLSLEWNGSNSSRRLANSLFGALMLAVFSTRWVTTAGRWSGRARPNYLEALNHRRHSANSITGMKLWPRASSIIARPRSIANWFSISEVADRPSERIIQRPDPPR
jgi:hypothetical protein